MNLLNVPILKRLYPSVVRRYLMLIGKFKIDILINKFVFEIDIRESIERKTYFLKEYEKKRMEKLIKYSDKNKSRILLDVGANIGFYTILLSDKFKEIYSFEPNERNFQILSKNIKKNNINKIKIFNYGLGEKEELLKGNSNTKGELFQTSGFAISDSNEGLDVQVKKGDDVLDLNNKNITIKIDVEGFEFFVLKGLRNILSNNQCVLQIEIWEKNVDRVHKFLKSLNYKIMCSIDGDTFFSNKISD